MIPLTIAAAVCAQNGIFMAPLASTLIPSSVGAATVAVIETAVVDSVGAGEGVGLDVDMAVGVGGGLVIVGSVPTTMDGGPRVLVAPTEWDS